MREFHRVDRLGAELRRELAEVLRDTVRDPRLGVITIQEVRVTRDLAHAKVFFTCMDGDAKATEKLLNRTLGGFLRRELARRIRLRSMPELHFVYDTSIAHGAHLAELIQAVVKEGVEDEKQP
jgi:ribosome-binding factor A